MGACGNNVESDQPLVADGTVDQLVMNRVH
jgi:hypothetical protein